MIQLVIIDDNPIILKGLELRIPCGELGLELAGTYQSAAQALETMCPERAYVVLTDIAMPDMDGLDFIELAQKRFPLCAFICITGYEKIEYMHRAIEYRVTSFLNKPVDDDKLRRALEKAIGILHRQMEYNTLFSAHELQHNSEILIRLLDGKIEREGLDNLRTIGKIQNEASLRVVSDDVFRRALDAVPANCSSEELKGIYPINNLLFSMNDAALNRELPAFRGLCVRRYLDGDLCATLNALVLDAHEVVCGFRPKAVAGGENLSDAVLSKIRLMLQRRNAADAADYAADAVKDMLRAGESVEGLGTYVRKLERMLCSEERSVGEMRFPMLAFGSLEDMKRWIRASARCDLHEESDVAAALYRYVRENVSSSLSLKSLSNVVHMHPNYIGQLIKERYGMPFNDLLNKMRIEWSVELMKVNPEIKMGVLAEQVGYFDPKYFSRVFKLYTGVAPSAYVRRLKMGIGTGQDTKNGESAQKE